jgi:uncharacterized protein
VSAPAAGGGAGRALVAPATPVLRILSDGFAGHEAQTLGLAEAMGLKPDVRHIAPRPFFAALAPFGPIDWRERETIEGSPIAPPFPDIAMGSGRRTLPYLRRLKQASKRQTFTVYLNRPANGLRAADFIVAPVHDGLFGRNVVAPITPPNRVSAELLARLRRAPDPRVASLPKPRAALLIGGDNRHFQFSKATAAALCEIVRVLNGQGISVMATCSRRTPLYVFEALKAELAQGSGWLWEGEGDNPYFSILAQAETIVVTADSVAMIGEAAATGAPVYVFAVAGGSRKIADYLSKLETLGAVRPWSGVVEHWRYEPVQSTPQVASAVWRAYKIYRGISD